MSYYSLKCNNCKNVSSLLDELMGSSYIMLKGDTLRTIQSNIGSKLPGSFKGEDL